MGRARTAIFLAVKSSIEEKKSKTVLMSPFTIPEVVELVLNAGGIPYFVDFFRDSTFFDLNILNESIKLNPSSIIITHYSLNQIHYKELSELCRKNNINLIEDSAIALSGKCNGININSLSDYSLYSFSSFKFLNFFYGGAISVKKEKLFSINNMIKNWKPMKINSYWPQVLRSSLYSLFTSTHFYNFITLNYIKYKSKSKNNDLDIIDNKFKNNNVKIDNSYFSLLPKYAILEILRKFDNYINDKKNRILIAKEYFKHLEEITIGSNYPINDLISQSDNFNFLIKCKDKHHKKYLKNCLLKKNINVGSQIYPNCHLIKNIKVLKEKVKILEI